MKILEKIIIQKQHSRHFHVQSNNVNPLSANPEKWSNTLKQFVGNLTTNFLSVFDHFMNLALKGLTRTMCEICSKLTKKTPASRCFGVLIINYEQISQIFLVFPFLTFN